MLIFSSCAQKSLQETVKELNVPSSELKVVIDKSDYTLSVFHKDKKLITYPCVFGFNAVDDKSREGDGCTPEGTFKIRSIFLAHLCDNAAQIHPKATSLINQSTLTN